MFESEAAWPVDGSLLAEGSALMFSNMAMSISSIDRSWDVDLEQFVNVFENSHT